MKKTILAGDKTVNRAGILKIVPWRIKSAWVPACLIVLSCLMLVSSHIFAVAKDEADMRQVADENLLVQLKPHADRKKVKDYLLKEANAATIRDMHVDSEDYSTLIVRPPQGQSDETFKKIQAMIKTHSEIASVQRNYIAKSPLRKP